MNPLSYKEDKAAVGYHLTDGPDHCAVCEHFEPPNGCGKVAGSISRDGWCRLFKRDR